MRESGARQQHIEFAAEHIALVVVAFAFERLFDFAQIARGFDFRWCVGVPKQLVVVIDQLLAALAIPPSYLVSHNNGTFNNSETRRTV